MQRRIESPAKHAKTMNYIKTATALKKNDLNTCQDFEIAYHLMLALLIVNLYQTFIPNRTFIFVSKKLEQASLTGCPTTLEQERSFRPQLGPIRLSFGP